MRILCTGDYEYSGDRLDIGSYYYAEKDESGTLQQNSLFHALVDLYFNSGCYSYPARTRDDLKIEIKKRLGAGYNRYIFIRQTGTGLKKGSVKRLEDVPDNIAIDEDGKKMLWGELRSWSDYSKTQRANTITNLIAEMKTANVSTKKFYEILEQLETNSMRRLAG